MKKNCSKTNHSSTARSRRRRQKKYTTLLLLLLILSVPGAVLLTAHTKAQAEGLPEEPTYKYYTSIRVNSGDTLWEIAEKYRTEEYKDIPIYIEEVKEINHLTSSQITDGMYLCIPYYTTEYKA